MAYENEIPTTTRFQKKLIVAASGSNKQVDISYPIRSNQFLSVLNNLTNITPTSIVSSSTNKERNVFLLQKKKAQTFLRKYLIPTSLIPNKGNPRPYTEQNSHHNLNTKRQRLAKHKARFLGKIETLNVVFLGTPGSGKTTAITSVSTSNTIGSDVTVRDSLVFIKEKTPVALDYGEVTLSNRNLKLIGNPGQSRFNHMWHVSCKHADVFAILLDCTSNDIYDDLAQYWDTIKTYYSSQPILIGLTHTDLFDSYKYKKKNLQSVIGNEKTLHVSILDPRSKISIVSFLKKCI